MLDLEIAITQMKNNKSPGYNEISVNMIKAAGPIGTQWLVWVLRKICIENNIRELV
jgi:hypothetical protein